MQPLGKNTEDKYLDKKFWLDSSDRLMYEGKALNWLPPRQLVCLLSSSMLIKTSYNMLNLRISAEDLWLS